ncbi:MAG TPA: LON peptidase substrate-binding domain-containing protein, partial [Ktedonobacterales bacterium]
MNDKEREPEASGDDASDAGDTVLDVNNTKSAIEAEGVEIAQAIPTVRSVVDPEVEIPLTLPVLPLKDTVVYPYAVLSLGVGKARSIRLVDEALKGESLVTLVAQKDAS